MKRYIILWALGILVSALIASPALGALSQGSLKSLNQTLFFALVQGDIESLVVARDKGADVNATLLEAGLDAEKVFGPKIDDLIKTDADLPTWPALTWAAFLQDEEAVRVLIKSGALVNATDGNGTTALHWAAWTGNYPIVKMLLFNGANPNQVDARGRSAHDWAVLTGQTDVIRIIPAPQVPGDADKDGVVDHLDKCPNTPLGAEVDERGCWMAAYANFFDTAKAVVKRQYRPHLKRTAKVLQSHPEIKIILVGHTDSRGTDEYNLDLGQRRADAVRDLLVEYGVSADRLGTKSEGESNPIASNATSRGRAKNRRVEIRVWQPGME